MNEVGMEWGNRCCWWEGSNYCISLYKPRGLDPVDYAVEHVVPSKVLRSWHGI